MNDFFKKIIIEKNEQIIDVSKKTNWELKNQKVYLGPTIYKEGTYRHIENATKEQLLSFSTHLEFVKNEEKLSYHIFNIEKFIDNNTQELRWNENLKQWFYHNEIGEVCCIGIKNETELEQMQMTWSSFGGNGVGSNTRIGLCRGVLFVIIHLFNYDRDVDFNIKSSNLPDFMDKMMRITCRKLNPA